MARGDHVQAMRLGGIYSHHAIDVGDGSVIHYTGPTGPASAVARTPFERFAAGNDVRVRSYQRFFAAL